MSADPPSSSAQNEETDYDNVKSEVDYGSSEMADTIVHQDGEIISEEVLHEDVLGEDIEIQYVDDGETIINGEEVIIEGTGDEVLEDAESLVALSQGEHHKGIPAEYAAHLTIQNRDSLRSPRILRRSNVSQRSYVYEQGSSRQTPSKSNFPIVKNTKRLLPVATLQSGKVNDWREEQKRQLEICEIFEVLPDHLRPCLKKIVGLSDTAAIRSRVSVSTRRFPAGRDYGDISEETAARIYKESDQLEQQNNLGHGKKSMETAEYTDMPHLEEAPDQGEAAEQQIDVEHYDSGDETQMHENMQYMMDDDSELVEVHEYNDREDHRGREVIMPDMRQEYFGTNDVNSYSANQVMMSNQYQDARYCPGCKLHLKRSIFYHHSRMIKKYGICNMFTPKRFPCGYPGCDEKLGTVEKLCEHMHQIHNCPTDIKTEVFPNQEEFDQFLKQLEAKGGNFRMSRGNKMIKTGMVQYFRCNRTQAMSKDKTMRICDEVGIFGEPVGSGVLDRPSDPFVNPTIGGKPQLRTEEACTAFYRKAFLPDGSIEVRYCDHHLHEDERVRLPQQVKERIYEMHRKQLQPGVICLVLKEEKERYAIPGSAVDRKLQTLTSKDISAVISTRNSNARKRNKAKQEGRNIAADCDELIVDGGAPLTDVEQKCLDDYLRNEQVYLRQHSEQKRLENKKRHLRESIRNNVFHLGRYIRTSTFSELDMEALETICTLVKEAAAVTRMRNPNDPIKSEHSPIFTQNGGRMKKEDFNENNEDVYEESVVIEGTVDHDDQSYMSMNPTTSEQMQEAESQEEQEQIIVDSDHVVIEQPEEYMPPPPKKKRGRKPKEHRENSQKTSPVVKKEEDEEPEPAYNNNEEADMISLPSRTRTGRVVRPSRHLMDM